MMMMMLYDTNRLEEHRPSDGEMTPPAPSSSASIEFGASSSIPSSFSDDAATEGKITQLGSVDVKFNDDAKRILGPLINDLPRILAENKAKLLIDVSM